MLKTLFDKTKKYERYDYIDMLYAINKENIKKCTGTRIVLKTVEIDTK